MAGHRTVTTARSEVAYSCRMYVQYWAHQLKTGTARSYRASRNRISARELPLWVVLVSTMGERGPGRGRAFDLQCSTRSRSPNAPSTPHRAAARRASPPSRSSASLARPQDINRISPCFSTGSRILERALRRPVIWPGRAHVSSMGERAAWTRPRSFSP